MSPSRRATGDINILAMLEGQAPGRRLRALPAAVWYGAAGVLACSLLVAVAWLVRGATPARDADAATTAQVSTPPAKRALPAPPAPDSPGPGKDAHAPSDNLAIDLPSLHAPHAADGPVSVPAPDTYASPARGALIVDVPQPPAATPAPARAVAAGIPLATSARVTTTRLLPAALRHPPERPQPGYRTSAAAGPAHAHPDLATPRQKRGATAARTAPPASTADTDVALISAILQHTGPRNEAADAAGMAACADKACSPRMPARQ